VIPRDEIDPMLHAGAGVAWNVGRVDLFMEASASSNAFRNNPGSPFGSSVRNYSYTAGVRIPLRF